MDTPHPRFKVSVKLRAAQSDQAAVACEPIPQAALAVYAYIFAPPALQPELDNLEVNRRGVHYPVASCQRTRLRLSWQGVVLDRSGASGMATGVYEHPGRGNRSQPDHRIFRFHATQAKGHWALDNLAVDNPDYHD